MRFIIRIGVVLAWVLGIALGALLVTFLFALAIDPHGEGPVGEGMLFLAVFVIALMSGTIFGLIRADDFLRKR